MEVQKRRARDQKRKIRAIIKGLKADSEEVLREEQVQEDSLKINGKFTLS